MRSLLATLITAWAITMSIMPAAAQMGYPYGYDRYGRSLDPDCYRGPNQVYVCGPPGATLRRDHYERRYYRRAPGYGLDHYGRSTDPNCYRGPYGAYVC